MEYARARASSFYNLDKYLDADLDRVLNTIRKDFSKDPFIMSRDIEDKNLEEIYNDITYQTEIAKKVSSEAYKRFSSDLSDNTFPKILTDALYSLYKTFYTGYNLYLGVVRIVTGVESFDMKVKEVYYRALAKDLDEVEKRLITNPIVGFGRVLSAKIFLDEFRERFSWMGSRIDLLPGIVTTVDRYMDSIKRYAFEREVEGCDRGNIKVDMVKYDRDSVERLISDYIQIKKVSDRLMTGRYAQNIADGTLQYIFRSKLVRDIIKFDNYYKILYKVFPEEFKQAAKKCNYMFPDIGVKW